MIALRVGASGPSCGSALHPNETNGRPPGTAHGWPASRPVAQDVLLQPLNPDSEEEGGQPSFRVAETMNTPLPSRESLPRNAGAHFALARFGDAPENVGAGPVGVPVGGGTAHAGLAGDPPDDLRPDGARGDGVDADVVGRQVEG